MLARGKHTTRRSERLRLARHRTAMEIRERRVSLAAQAAQARDAMNNRGFQTLSRHRTLERLPGAGRHFVNRNQLKQLVPELLGTMQPVLSHCAQPVMSPGQDERLPAGMHACNITLQDGRAALLRTARKSCKPRAGSEADQVARERQRKRFVKIVDAPNDSALRVTPGTEVFDMEVADREHVRPLRGVTALLAPDLRPTIKGASKEFEGILPHPLVLAMQVFTDERGLGVEPRFVALGRAPDVHDGPASAGVRI